MLIACLALLGACGEAAPAARPDGAAEDGAADAVGFDLACPALPSGASGSPSSIADATGLANGLFAAQAAPLSLDCFLERLDRPLTVLGVVSDFSLQPSVGARSPRIFVFSGNLVMSVVPAGDGSPFLELAEYTAPTRSIKAQIEFPMAAAVPPAAPYDSVRLGSGTVCGGCHRAEQQAPQITFTEAYESGVFSPRPQDVVPLQKMQDDTRACDPAAEPERCAMLDALFNHGEVRTGAFSADAPTIFE